MREQNDCGSRFLILYEFTVVGASLFLGTALSYMLSPTAACADGSPCTVLRSADIALWTLCSSLFMMSVLATFIAATESPFNVTTASEAKFYFDNYGLAMLGPVFFCIGATMVLPAFATRGTILYLRSPDYPPFVAHFVVGTCGATVFSAYVFFYMFSVRLHGSRVSGLGFVAFFFGNWGWWPRPRQSIQKGFKEMDDPLYFLT